MNEPIKDYDCVAEVRKIRDKIDAKFAHDPEAWFEHLEGVPGRLFKSLGIQNDWIK